MLTQYCRLFVLLILVSPLRGQDVAGLFSNTRVLILEGMLSLSPPLDLLRWMHMIMAAPWLGGRITR